MTDATIPASDFVGDILDENPSSTTRIYIQNLNGLSWNSDGGKWPYVCEAMASIQADVSCFSELNTATTRYDIRAKMETLTRNQFEQNRLVLGAVPQKTTSAYQPGGTAILACNAITSNIKSQTRDRMGRWTSLSFRTSTTKTLRVISAYQVCHQSQPGSNTAYAHQRAQLIMESILDGDINRITPRQAFIHDLQNFIQQLQKAGEEIVLAGDFNDDVTDPQSGMSQLATTCGLVDLFSLRLGNATQPPTYQRGTKRLDYILISPALLPAVQAAGYDPFGYRLPSDHRGMFLDLNTDLVFEQSPEAAAPLTKRDFYTSTPGVISTYVTAKLAYLNDHHFFERLTQMEGLSAPDHEMAESLDRDFHRSSLHAARMCRKKPRAPWSPKLAEAWAQLHYFRILKSASKNPVNYLPAIRKIQQKWPGLPIVQATDQQAILDGRNQALNKLRQVRQEAQRHREEHLLQRQAQYLEMDDHQSAKVLSRIIRAESQKRVYAKIKHLRKSRQDSCLSFIKIPRNVSLHDVETIKHLPDTPDHWETLTVPEEIERILIQRNQQHFRQAEGTPFTQSRLLADVGYKADGYAADLILSGNYQSNNLSPATTLLIQHLQQRSLATLQGLLSPDDVLSKLKHWDENTTTSPSGLHLGHYHCMWRDPKLHRDDPTRETVIQQQKLLVKATVGLLNYALRFGYSYVRWNKVVNVMLHKDPGNPRIHRLRIIHIYEADYNLLLAVKWRQALHHAEDHNLLNKGLYGSRPGRSAHDPALIEVLQNETYRMSMKSGINFDLDASSCYDRILTNVAMISSRRMGVSPEVAQVNALTLERAQFHLKTKFGTSQQYYSHSPTNPIHGTGQGSGNSPTIWCFLCSALFDAFESAGHGANFTDYQRQLSVSMSMIGFVDDCTQRVNCFDGNPQPNTYHLMNLMQNDTQLWNDLLWASGGALEQSKCSFHLIQSDWNNHGHPFLRGGKDSHTLTLRHGHEVTTIQQKSNYESHKTLGCYINPAYTRSQSLKIITQKNHQFAELLEMNFFTRPEAWTFYTSVYLPAITYPLPITPLTSEQCQSLDTRFLRSLLPRCGYNRNMPRAVRYAPFHMGGAGFRPIYVVQGYLMLQQVYKLFNSPQQPNGQMLWITASWTQAFLGTSEFFLTHVHSPIPPASPSYLLDLRRFLQEINGSITLQNPPVPKLLRQRDRSIMDIALSQTQWTKVHLTQINACRRFCQAQTLADITNLSGTRLLQWTTHTDPTASDSRELKISAFNQRKPGLQAWKTWGRFLSTISNRYGVLYNPLENWTVDVSQLRHWPPSLYDPTTDTLMSHSSGSTYTSHTRYAPGIFAIQPSTHIIQARGYPTATHITMDTLRPSRNFVISPDASPIPVFSWTMGGYGVDLSSWEHELLKDCRYLVSHDDIQRLLDDGPLITCSDGSAQRTGSFGFVIATPNGRRLVKGSGQAFGSYPNSFRSEAYGVLATMRWIHHALQAWSPSKRIEVTHYLDNTSVIRRIEKTKGIQWHAANHRLLPEQDIIDEIVHTIKGLNAQIEFRWVRGHQDSTTQYAQLPLPAQLNCDADSLATSAETSLLASDTVPTLPNSQCQLILQHKSITSHLKQRVYAAATIPQLQTYLQSKFEWSEITAEHIDWEMYQYIIKKYKANWATIVKHLHAFSPTGKIAHRNDQYQPHECPCCSEPYESNNHVMTCPHASRQQWRETTIIKMYRYHNRSIDPHLTDILRDGLSRFHRQLPVMAPQAYPDRYQHLIITQNAIGWDHIYRGRWSVEWRILQDRYSATEWSSGPQITGTSWILGLGRLAIDQWLQLWHLRNQERHGADLTRHSKLRQQRLHAELHDLYQYRDQVCPRDKSIFYPSIADHIAAHPSHDAIEAWILTHREAIFSSAKLARQLGISMNRTINEYPTFNPIVQANEHSSMTAGMLMG